MSEFRQLLSFSVCICIFYMFSCTILSQKPGHLKKFGCCGKILKVDEINEWTATKYFMDNYVAQSAPLLMKHVVKKSPAFKLWTDEYFLSLDPDSDKMVDIEINKKENRNDPSQVMSFHEWVKTYNNSDSYMVQDIPKYLGKDVVLPLPLQCPFMRHYLTKAVFWFSSGGTKSVVHIDTDDNILCLYRGTKSLVLVDPHRYGDKIPLDMQGQSYSSLDVDSVDFEKYPLLAEDIEYYHVNLSAGDCLFIPYTWIHQVDSFESNIAVNVWWNHHQSVANRDRLGDCENNVDDSSSLTLDKLTFSNDDHVQDEDLPLLVRDHIISVIRRSPHKQLDIDSFASIISQESDNYKTDPELLEQITKAYNLADLDGDGVMTLKEILNLAEKDNVLKKFNEAILRAADVIDRLEETSDERDNFRIVRDEL